MTTGQNYDGPFFAHTGKTTNGADWQLLVDHLIAVGAGAEKRAQSVDLYRQPASPSFETPTKIAGWLHDLGKYRPEFQDHLFGRPVCRDRTYHKQAGASKAALLDYIPAAFAIAGHHGGMPARADLQGAVRGANGRVVVEQVWEIACRENPALSSLASCDAPLTKVIDIDFASRIVLSCLVDADWEDTSSFQRSLDGLTAEPLPPTLAPERSLERMALSRLRWRAD